MLLTGCAQMDKTSLTTFEPLKPSNGIQEFKFRAISGIFKSPADPESEKERMEWLGMWLNDNNMCKNGFLITDRNSVSLGPGFYESNKHIYYTGQCK